MPDKIIPSQYQKPLSLLMDSLLRYPDGRLKTLDELPDIETLWNDKRRINGLPREYVEMAHRSAGFVMRGFRKE